MLSAIVIALILFYLSFTRDCHVLLWPEKEFAGSLWKASSDENRYFFIKDLLSNHTLFDKNKSAVIGMLGKPSYSTPDNEKFSYVVRSFDEGGCGFNFIAMLDIEFENGKVVDTRMSYD